MGLTEADGKNVTGRMTIKSVLWLMAGVLALTGPACHRKAKEAAPLQRKEAANYASEAEFAVTLKDFARAAQLYTQAAGICPDDAGYWMNAGFCRRRLDQRAEARKAYEAALGIYREAASRDRTNLEPVTQEIRVLALLGRVDEAKSVLEKARSAHAGKPGVQNLTAQSLDAMIADPGFKALMP